MKTQNYLYVTAAMLLCGGLSLASVNAFGQVNFFSTEGVIIHSSAQIHVNGSMDQNGDLENNGELHMKNYFNCGGPYSGEGSLIFSGDQAAINCVDTINTLICSQPNGVWLQCYSDVRVGEVLDLATAGIDLNGFVLHLGSPEGVPILSQYNLDNFSGPLIREGMVRQNLVSPSVFTFPVGSNGLSFPLEVNTLNQTHGEAWVQVSAHNAPAPFTPDPENYLIGYWYVLSSGMPSSGWEVKMAYPETMVVGDETLFQPMNYVFDEWEGPEGSNAPVELGTSVIDPVLNRISYLNFADPNLITAFEHPALGCPGDFDGDNNITTSDLLIFLGQLGCTLNCTADMNGDDVVNASDLLSFLGLFGMECF